MLLTMLRGGGRNFRVVRQKENMKNCMLAGHENFDIHTVMTSPK